MALRLRTLVASDVFIIHCDGRIVYGDEGATLRERIKSLLAGTSRIVVNLNGVDSIDSGGLGILVGLLVSARNRGGDLKLVSPSEHVSGVLRQTRVDTIFRIYGSDDEALAAFRQKAA
jgi:anti-sigma B factor antagonist